MKHNVMIFPSGSEIGLEINNALKYSKFINVFGASSISDHSDYVYKNLIKNLPYYTEVGFIDKLNKVIEENNIEFIYPALDAVQLFLTENQKDIRATIITSDIETLKICNSKKETYDYFENESFIPRYFRGISECVEYPVFVKPKIGCGSKGAKIVKNKKELEYELSNNKDIIICEYLSGDEYTVDCFTGINGELKTARPRSRSRIKCGISVHSDSMIPDDEILKIATTLNKKLKFNGAWFFQLKKNSEEKLKLLEVSARIPGTMGVSRNVGINFPLLTIYNFLGIETELINNDYDIHADRAFINRYFIDFEYNSVYVDLDDTLIVDGKVNCTLMMYLYQCCNNHKKIVLLTKHADNVECTLDRFRIDRMLFNEIIHIKNGDKKSQYILDKASILIDDSFAERKDVKRNVGIPVFDLDMIEALIDWRT